MPELHVQEPVTHDGGHDDDEGLVQYLKILWRYKWLIAVMGVVGIAGGVVASALQRPMYPAHVSMEIQKFNDDFLNMGKNDPTNQNYDSDAYVQTQIQIMQSDSLMERVQKKVPLNGSFAVSEPWAVEKLVRRALGFEPRESLTQLEEAQNSVTESMKVRGSGLTRVIDILCESPDPAYSADFLNTLAAEYIQQNLEERWKSAQNVTNWLTNQLKDLKAKLQDAEERLNAETRSMGLVTQSSQQSLAEQKLRQVQDELFRVQADRMAKQSRYEQAVKSGPESLPEVLDDASLRDMNAKIADLKRQLAELRTTLTPAHPSVKRVEAQLAELTTEQLKRRSYVLDRIAKEYEGVQRRESLLQTEFGSQLSLATDQSRRTVNYEMLKREVETKRQMYDGILQKVTEAGVSAAIPVTNIRIVDPAKPALIPSRPDRKLNLTLGLLAGLFFAGAIALIRERGDHSLKLRGEARNLLHLPELGFIPAAKVDPAVSALAPGGPKWLRSTPLLGSAPDDTGRLGMVTWNQKTSLTAECYRSTLASILNCGGEHQPRVLVFASPGTEEGKTTTVSNLGIVLSEVFNAQDQRVLIIDADLRRPRLHEVFNVPNKAGLADLLNPEREMPEGPLAALTQETPIPGLDLLCAGAAGSHTWNLLHLPRMGELLAGLEKEYSMIFIDTPPISSFSDARVISRYADAVVLVARAGDSERDDLLRARQQFLDDDTQILGTILTHWSPEDSDSFAAYYKYQ